MPLLAAHRAVEQKPAAMQRLQIVQAVAVVAETAQSVIPEHQRATAQVVLAEQELHHR
jgi:hypothetical protein